MVYEVNNFAPRSSFVPPLKYHLSILLVSENPFYSYSILFKVFSILAVDRATACECDFIWNRVVKLPALCQKQHREGLVAAFSPLYARFEFHHRNNMWFSMFWRHPSGLSCYLPPTTATSIETCWVECLTKRRHKSFHKKS